MIWILALLTLVQGFQQYCKCECTNETVDAKVLTVDSCNQCTQTLCLGKEQEYCTPVNLKLTCYQIESVKDMMIIYVFTIGVIILLGYSVLRAYRR